MASKLKVIKVRVDDETYYKFLHYCMMVRNSMSKEARLLILQQITKIEQAFDLIL